MAEEGPVSSFNGTASCPTRRARCPRQQQGPLHTTKVEARAGPRVAEGAPQQRKMGQHDLAEGRPTTSPSTHPDLAARHRTRNRRRWAKPSTNRCGPDRPDRVRTSGGRTMRRRFEGPLPARTKGRTGRRTNPRGRPTTAVSLDELHPRAGGRARVNAKMPTSGPRPTTMSRPRNPTKTACCGPSCPDTTTLIQGGRPPRRHRGPVPVDQEDVPLRMTGPGTRERPGWEPPAGPPQHHRPPHRH